MTLFIACLLIYNFEMDWKLYIVAIVIWTAHIGMQAKWLDLVEEGVSEKLKWLRNAR